MLTRLQRAKIAGRELFVIAEFDCSFEVMYMFAMTKWIIIILNII